MFGVTSFNRSNFFFNFYCYSITVVCLFSPSLHPTPSEPIKKTKKQGSQWLLGNSLQQILLPPLAAPLQLLQPWLHPYPHPSHSGGGCRPLPWVAPAAHPQTTSPQQHRACAHAHSPYGTHTTTAEDALCTSTLETHACACHLALWARLAS